MSQNFSMKNRYIFWMAWRYLIARRKGSGLSFMTIVSILGIAIGVMVLIVVMSVMGGFGDDWHKKMLSGTPHLEITAKNSLLGFSLSKYPMEELSRLVPDTEIVQPYIQSDVILKHSKYIQPVVLFGVDPNQTEYPWSFGKKDVEQNHPDFSMLLKEHRPILSHDDSTYPGVILGEGLARNLNVSEGDEVTILNPQNVISSGVMVTDGVVSKKYVVVGLFFTGSADFDNKWAITSLDNARKFLLDYDTSLDTEQYVSGIAINVKDPFRVDALKKVLITPDKRYEELKTITWQETNSALLFALKLEKYTMGSILMLIVLVAAFSISCTLMMTVYHKRTQLSLLRAIGMSKEQVIKLFLSHGFVIASVGIFLGLVCGIGLCFLISSLKFISLPQGLYYMKYLPVKFMPWSYVVICICSWFLSLVAAVYPAYIGANRNPVDGLNV